MFSNFFFLILLLVLLTSTPQKNSSVLDLLSLAALAPPLLSCTWLLGHFWKQSSQRLTFCCNVFLLLALFIFLPLFSEAPKNQFLKFFWILSTLILYFAGLLTAHFGHERQIAGRRDALSHAWREIALPLPLVFPLVFPFLLFTLLQAFLSLIPHTYAAETTLAYTAAGMSLLLIVLFLPPLMVKTWGCNPLQNSALEKNLQELCTSAGFHHAGFRRWPLFKGAVNAAVFGITGRFRYIVFTDTLLQALRPDCIKAVLSHEIGHTRHKHLLFYPLILSGMLLAVSPLSLLISQRIIALLELPYAPWRSLLFYAVFIPLCALYYRFLFGHFSRLFERQADLHLFALKIPPEHMIEALRSTARTETAIKKPNWHHYSVDERIKFIESATNNPWLISRHHRKVKTHLALLLISLTIALFYVS
jgi:STE24 endopeptidase